MRSESSVVHSESVQRLESLTALAGQVKTRLNAAQRQVDAVTPLLLARAWTSSPPAWPGFAFSLREILRARSQRARLCGELVPQTPNDEPVEKLLERARLSYKPS